MSDWKAKLNKAFKDLEKAETQKEVAIKEAESQAVAFTSKVILPAFEEIKMYLEESGREVVITDRGTGANITIQYQKHFELNSTIRADGGIVYAEHTHSENGRRYKAEGFLRNGSSDTIDKFSKSDIIDYVVDRYVARLMNENMKRGDY